MYIEDKMFICLSDQGAMMKNVICDIFYTC